MKAILFSILTLMSCSIYSQTTIKLPGDAGKPYKIDGDYMGEMIRSTGGVDKTKERYYLLKDGASLIIWKHILNIENGQTELLTKTTSQISDIDWAYFESSNGEAPTEKSEARTIYYVFGINVIRGKRFKQIKYTRETPDDVTVGNLDIQVNSKAEADAFFAAVKAAK
jgi:hypothetical protein